MMNHTNNIIEFNAPSTIPVTSVLPWLPPTKRYQDLVLKPEFADRRYKFPTTPTWFRIVPALPGSERDWMLGINALQYSGGRHAHASTIIRGGKSVFDHAYAWLKENRRDALFSKTNKEGIRLLTDPYYLCWILVGEGESLWPACFSPKVTTVPLRRSRDRGSRQRNHRTSHRAHLQWQSLEGRT